MNNINELYESFKTIAEIIKELPVKTQYINFLKYKLTLGFDKYLYYYESISANYDGEIFVKYKVFTNSHNKYLFDIEIPLKYYLYSEDELITEYNAIRNELSAKELQVRKEKLKRNIVDLIFYLQSGNKLDSELKERLLFVLNMKEKE